MKKYKIIILIIIIDWDSIIKRMAELNIPEDQASKIKEEILHKEGENLRRKR